MSLSRRRSGLGSVVIAACLLIGCGKEPAAEERANDATILEQYLDEYPELVQNHGQWHSENHRAEPDYGDYFLGFHHRVLLRYDTWRVEHGYAPLEAWDPGTPIPASAPHAGRASADPSAVDPLCRLPSWFTLEGGDARDPDFGAGRLIEFVSSNQLGRALDSQTDPAWHTRVHATIGGDLENAHRVVLDPIFWNFHKFIDDLWGEWQTATGQLDPQYTTTASP